MKITEGSQQHSSTRKQQHKAARLKKQKKQKQKQKTNITATITAIIYHIKQLFSCFFFLYTITTGTIYFIFLHILIVYHIYHAWFHKKSIPYISQNKNMYYFCNIKKKKVNTYHPSRKPVSRLGGCGAAYWGGAITGGPW